MTGNGERIFKNIFGALLLVAIFTACDDDDDVLIIDRDAAFADFQRTNFFQEADVNADNQFDEVEFNNAFFTAFDVNNDGVITQPELAVAEQAIILDTPTDFDAADLDADERLDRTEFATAFSANNAFETFDADATGTVIPREFSDGIFAAIDADGDGIIAETEFRTIFDRHFGPFVR